MEELIKRAAQDLANSSYAIALTGAGMSTESGIPDFRGPSGIWTKNPDAERRAYRSYEFFMENPKGWWVERVTGPNIFGDLAGYSPNAGHIAIGDLEKYGILKTVITQNIDGLHEKGGTKNLLEYHGCALKLRCVSCLSRMRREEIDLELLLKEDRLPPVCSVCGGVIKTDTVGFGEPIPEDVAEKSLEEAWKCDLMLICGTSAVVYPFANLPRIARQKKANYEIYIDPSEGKRPTGKTTVIEINAEPTPLTQEGISDYLIQGRIGEILPKIAAEVMRIRQI
ncbi:MAG: NAD-dependent deacylase [Deltaproteobacteria bacterium]|nr:NAD-dependent deacylase [Deltaproteobacteria bacterium]